MNINFYELGQWMTINSLDKALSIAKGNGIVIRSLRSQAA